MYNNTATVTITVNISAPDLYEGNAEFRMTIKEKHLPYVDVNKLAAEMGRIFEQARAEYYKKNEEA